MKEIHEEVMEDDEKPCTTEDEAEDNFVEIEEIYANGHKEKPQGKKYHDR
jgi:hypothetical protein